jgi:hypothetical protein
MNQSWIHWRWLEIVSMLLGAPLLAIYAAARWPSLSHEERRRAALGASAIALIVCLSGVFRLTLASPHANMAAIAAVYICYCSFAAICLRRGRWILGTVLCLHPLAGIFLGTLGVLALFSMLHDYEPMHEEWTLPGVRCRVTTQGVAGGRTDAKTITLYKGLPLMPFLERRILEKRTEWENGERQDAAHWSELCRDARPLK